jgi:pilus assembly protein Flp/PilA
MNSVYQGGDCMNKLLRFMKDEEGVTAIEYALIASLIALAITAAVTSVGSSIINIFTRVSTNLK